MNCIFYLFCSAQICTSDLTRQRRDEKLVLSSLLVNFWETLIRKSFLILLSLSIIIFSYENVSETENHFALITANTLKFWRNEILRWTSYRKPPKNTILLDWDKMEKSLTALLFLLRLRPRCFGTSSHLVTQICKGSPNSSLANCFDADCLWSQLRRCQSFEWKTSC